MRELTRDFYARFYHVTPSDAQIEHVSEAGRAGLRNVGRAYLANIALAHQRRIGQEADGRTRFDRRRVFGKLCQPVGFGQ